jgi:NADH pyrophosphatase NudC (nudix superfamily)
MQTETTRRVGDVERGRKLPDEYVLIEMERRAAALVANHRSYRFFGWDGERDKPLERAVPCGCGDCQIWEDLTCLIALVRDLKDARCRDAN